MLLLKVGGPIPFLHQLRRQIWSRANFLGMEKTLNAESVQVPCAIEYRLRPASKEDLEEMVRLARLEGKEAVRELVQRKWFYDCGFHDCYVARTVKDNELCYVQWLVSRVDNKAIDDGFGNRLPRLQEDEILVENAFTFSKYRGNRLYPSALLQLAEVARKRGFRRMLVYVREDNIASLKGCERAGFRVFEKVPEVKLLLLTKRSHS